MSELTTEERLAALQARRKPRVRPQTATPQPVAAQPAAQLQPHFPGGRQWPEPQHRSGVADPLSPAVDTVMLSTVQVMEPAPAPTLQRFDQTMLMPAVPMTPAPTPTNIQVDPMPVTGPTVTGAEPPSPILERAESIPGGAAKPMATNTRTIPWERITATGASVISFASMMVAMGPILKSMDTTQVETTAANDGAAVEVPAAGVAAATPAAPAVDIQVASGVDGGIAPAADAQMLNAQAQLATPSAVVGDGAASTMAAVDNSGATQQTQVSAAPSTEAAPQPASDAGSGQTSQTTTSPAPTTAAPTPAAPDGEAPTTAAPTTAPPTTAAPTTAAPTTAPPTTAPAETPPPRSEGSG